MSSVFFSRGATALAAWSSPWQPYRVALARASYEPNAQHHRRISQVSELPGFRQELVNRSVATHEATKLYLAESVLYSRVKTNESFSWAIVFRAGETDADSELICALDMGRAVPLRGVTSHRIRWSGGDRTGVICAITFSPDSSPHKREKS